MITIINSKTHLGGDSHHLQELLYERPHHPAELQPLCNSQTKEWVSAMPKFLLKLMNGPFSSSLMKKTTKNYTKDRCFY